MISKKYEYIVTFLKRLNMNSLIANKVKTIMGFLYIVRTTLCATISNLYNNYLFVILLYTSVLLSIVYTLLFARSHTCLSIFISYLLLFLVYL